MNELFTIAKVRDFDVIILKDNGWINYTKLCKDLTGIRTKFRDLINDNKETFLKLFTSYEQNSWREFPPTEISIQNLKRIHLLLSYNNVDNNFKGTYGPKYLLDFIIIKCDISYYKLIHEALELIDNYANSNNKSVNDEINEIKERYLFKIDELKKIHSGEIKEKDNCIKRLEEKIDIQSSLINRQISLIEEQSKKINNQTKILTEVKHSLTTITDSVTDLNKHITSNMICRYHILLWLDKNNQNKNYFDEDVIIKTFIGLVEDTPKLTEIDKILLKEDVSCSLDSFKQVLDNLSNMAFTTDYRNIIIKQYKIESFITKFKCGLIDINNPIESIKDTIMNLESTVKEQNTRLEKIETSLTKICQIYGITEEKYREIENNVWSFKFKNRWRKIKINNTKNKLYINYGRNNSEIYYLENGDI